MFNVKQKRPNQYIDYVLCVWWVFQSRNIFKSVKITQLYRDMDHLSIKFFKSRFSPQTIPFDNILCSYLPWTLEDSVVIKLVLFGCWVYLLCLQKGQYDRWVQRQKVTVNCFRATYGNSFRNQSALQALQSFIKEKTGFFSEWFLEKGFPRLLENIQDRPSSR